MNDRFKFRVWDVRKEQYLNTDNVFIDATGVCYHFDTMCERFDLMQYDVIVEQCTGLTDKNGKLIYEGDVLRATCTDGKYIDYPVGWWDGAFHMYYVDKSLIAETGTIQFCLRGLVSFNNCNYREIIGNIHEMEVEK